MLTELDREEIERSIAISYIHGMRALTLLRHAERQAAATRPRTAKEQHWTETGHELAFGCCSTLRGQRSA